MYASALTELARALDKDGFEIVRKHGMDWREILRRREAERLRAWELGVTPPMGGAFRVSEARRTGDWSEVTDADWTAWVNALRDRKAFESSVLAAIERDRQPDEDAPGYLKAVRLLRGALPSIKEIDDALAGSSPDGSQGNVWVLRQRIVDRRPPAGPFWGEPEAVSFEQTSARATVEMPPGKRVGAGVHDREGAEGAEVLGVFWTDGVVSFSGDAGKMKEFLDQIARLAPMPATEAFL
ncbi:hypothetical protein [Methylobacterium sp. B1]|uniref:hypothetical protein n=1 Tax=Methylobacterium sp. B1 TaxID=91459 RepID=UPI00034C50A1|nr:hypothetical protein [Methylobacterium sp. B1]